MEANFTEKYLPKTIQELPLNPDFNELIQNFIDVNDMKIILISDDDYIKNIVVNAILNSFNITPIDILYVSQLKDQGVSSMRYELKLFCQTPSTVLGKKKILVLDDFQVFSDNIQKLIVNNIDKWGKNINIITTSNTIYSVDESITSRLVSISIPSIIPEVMRKQINTICKNENICLTNDSIDYLLKTNKNNIQTIFNILQKCKLLKNNNSQDIDIDILQRCSTLINFQDLDEYLLLCKKNKTCLGYKLLKKFIDNGYSVIDILNEIYFYFKLTPNLNENQKYNSFRIISDYIIKFITVHEEEIELLLFTYDICKILQ